jgi:FkbM family methyltransferase
MIDYKKTNLKINEIPISCYDTGGSTTASGTYYAIISNKFRFNDVGFNDGDTYVEVGAHNGLLSFYLAKMYPNINIHIFECNPIMVKAINMGIIENNISNITCYPFGLSSETKNSMLGINLQNTGGSSLMMHSGHSDKINVNIFDFETILSIFNKIKYIKIDIEGEEFKIFKKLIDEKSSFFDKVEVINLELHDGVYKELNVQRSSILDYLSSFKDLKLILQD